MIEQARELLDELHTERLSYDEYCLLRNALDSLEAERDAAVDDWREAAESSNSKLVCAACVHRKYNDDDDAMTYCGLNSACRPLWRGPADEEGE